MQLIDTHCHLTFEELSTDVDAVLARSIAAGVMGWITVGTTSEENQKVIALAASHENMYAALGMHPHYAKDVSDGDIEKMKQLAKGNKVVAIGETGLDFHYNFSAQDAQRGLFRKVLTVAADLDLPVIVHSRNAFAESMRILDEFAGKLKRVLIHCFGGTAEETAAALDRGFYISFTGIVTFKKADQACGAVKLVPMDRLMVETDCPYISPEPMRNQRPCEPALMVHTARKLAELKEMDFESFAAEVTKTTKDFFDLP